MSNLVYEGTIKIDTTKKDGTPLMYNNKPYRKFVFKTAEGWTRVPDWNDIGTAINDGDKVMLAYAPKLDDFNQPVLFNGKPEYTLKAIQLVEPTGAGSQQTITQAQNGPAPTTTTHELWEKDKLSARQTALNVSANVYAALLGAGAISSEGIDVVQVVIDNADRFHAYLITGKADPFDQQVSQAQSKLDAAIEETPADADDREDPGPDDDIPF